MKKCIESPRIYQFQGVLNKDVWTDPHLRREALDQLMDAGKHAAREAFDYAPMLSLTPRTEGFRLQPTSDGAWEKSPPRWLTPSS